jgi:beta-lactamase class A
MRSKKYKIFLLAFATPMIFVLFLIISCRELPPEKAQAPTYPSLWDSFDPDFNQALETALKNEFQGEYRQAVENKKAAFVVVDITDLQHPKVAGVNSDVMLYAASMPKIAILLGAFVKI